MSLESDRRGIGTALAATRQAGGKALEAERKNTGASISNDRAGSGAQVSDDLNRLVTVKRKSSALPLLEARGGVPATKGVGKFDPKNAPATGGGIASPLTESDFTAREYWPDGMLSSDGLFSIPAIKKLVLADANGGQAVINLAQPIPVATTP